ncbi:acyl-CoA synthetase [Sphingopyxis granuli]|uniref:Acyl-CoA synthetase n=1 Tax=Sphingopyxis granuli TaxID=267128 RepID=A0AA86GIV8_9SPHN|nr:acyl-CoA synthetase [Sphingopyxis granuli]AMG73589.1 Acyl-CoA synthetase [Sphingopyxis granuli]
MHPFVHARATPDKPAYIMAGSGEAVSYAELEAAANRAAHLFRRHGLRRGDNVALLMENSVHYYPIFWAAQRAGLYLTGISTRLTAGEAEYIVRNAGAKLLVTSAALKTVALLLADRLADVALYMAGGIESPFRSWEDAVAAMPSEPVADESPGALMLYSSGTTGQPKGVKHPLPTGPIDEPNYLVELMLTLYGGSRDMVYLSPAPLYHAAPLSWSTIVHRLGGTVILMERFDEERALELIDRYRVTHSQWVPTHFSRMLKLPEAVRARYDMSSMVTAIHAAAPCPVPVKEAMIAWWGPIIHEYYGGTESCGTTHLSTEEWLVKKGSVGRARLCEVHICNDEGEPLPAGKEGLVYFAGGNDFEYHLDPEKTAASRNRLGWKTLGDIGRLDEDGYLFLTDRKSFTIISGGVNIYPQEIENLLVTHPKVADAAVIGAPDEDMGERVVAVVQPLDPADSGEALAEELKLFCRASLSGLKVPRQIDFRDELPRQPTGKLYKRLLRDEYRQRADQAATART